MMEFLFGHSQGSEWFSNLHSEVLLSAQCNDVCRIHVHVLSSHQMAPDYDHLTLFQKVEVFEYALENTTGDDLAKVIWFKSPTSEVWFDRRTNFTRSLAVMSMVGYVLGLGDR